MEKSWMSFEHMIVVRTYVHSTNIWYHKVPYVTIWYLYGTIPYGTIWYHKICYGTMACLTSYLAPFMAAIYVFSAVLILLANITKVPTSFGMIISLESVQSHQEKRMVHLTEKSKRPNLILNLSLKFILS